MFDFVLQNIQPLKLLLLNHLYISASDVTNGNSNIAESLTNNNLTAGTVETAAKMKRQSSLQSSSSPPAVSRDRTGSEADANMTSLSGQ